MWKITIDARTDDGNDRYEDQIPTPHLGIAIDTALHRHGLFNARRGSYQITAVVPDGR